MLQCTRSYTAFIVSPRDKETLYSYIAQQRGNSGVDMETICMYSYPRPVWPGGLLLSLCNRENIHVFVPQCNHLPESEKYNT